MRSRDDSTATRDDDERESRPRRRGRATAAMRRDDAATDETNSAPIAGGRISAAAGANLLGQHGADRNAEATVYVGNLDAQVTEELVWELFLQAGPVTNVYVPKDRVTSTHQGYGFVELRNEEDAEYVRRAMRCDAMGWDAMGDR